MSRVIGDHCAEIFAGGRLSDEGEREVRVPTSVLLAVLAAAGLLALAPALVRRYDATERLVAERAQSTARVLERRRRRRTVPGRLPVRPARIHVVRPVSAVPGSAVPASAVPASAVPGSAVPGSAGPGSAVPGFRPSGAGAWGTSQRALGLRPVSRAAARRRRQVPPPHTPAVYRRRRVFAALLLLNLVELMGVALVSPGFWISFSVTGTLLVTYVVHLRNRAIDGHRRRQVQAREAAWLAARQAEVRREQARRAAARRETHRRLAAQREVVRRAAMGMDRESDLPAAASGGGRAAGSISYRRAGGLRGRAYEARRGTHSA